MHRRSACVLAVAALLVAGCAGDETGDARDTSPQSNEAMSSTTTSLPGERQEIYPYQGARLAVVGVTAGDTLKVRSGPGTEFEVVMELSPTAMNATATGHNRSLPDRGFWSEVTVDDRTGWANGAYLLQPGRVDDITAGLYPTPAQRPTAKTMTELGERVARHRAGDDPEADVVVVAGPTSGDVEEVTVDIVGLGDDSVGGERLNVFAERSPAGYTVRSVEATAFCRRGVTEARRCV